MNVPQPAVYWPYSRDVIKVLSAKELLDHSIEDAMTPKGLRPNASGIRKRLGPGRFTVGVFREIYPHAANKSAVPEPGRPKRKR